MGIIVQNSRVSHHTITQPGLTFSIPEQEDFTLNGTQSWQSNGAELCYSEIGVNEIDERVFIRVGESIKEFQFTTASTNLQTSLTETQLTRTDTVEVDILGLNFGTGIKSIDGSTSSSVITTPTSTVITHENPYDLSSIEIASNISMTASQGDVNIQGDSVHLTTNSGGATMSISSSQDINILTSNSINIVADGATGSNSLFFDNGIAQISTDNGKGLQYPGDYSATFEQYSLVDKNYVDTHIPPAPTLNDVLIAGNEIGTQSIDFGNNLYIKSFVTGMILDGINSDYSIHVETGTGMTYSSILSHNSIFYIEKSDDNMLQTFQQDLNGTVIKTESFTEDRIIAVTMSGTDLITSISMPSIPGVYHQQTSSVFKAERILNNGEYEITETKDSTFPKSQTLITQIYDDTQALRQQYYNQIYDKVSSGVNQASSTLTVEAINHSVLSDDSQEDYVFINNEGVNLGESKGSSYTNFVVNNDNGFYKTQFHSTGVLRGVSKERFVSIQTTNGATVSVVYPLSGLEIGTGALAIKATVTALNSAEDKAYVAELYAAIRINSYTPTIFGNDKLQKTEFTTATATIEIDGTSNLAIRVTGETATTIDWSIKYQVIYSV
jgi:hypothetical protein